MFQSLQDGCEHSSELIQVDAFLANTQEALGSCMISVEFSLHGLVLN